MRVPNVGGNVTMTNWSLAVLISAAWDLEPGQLSGGPSWLGSDRYDILAKTAPNATQADLRTMLQALLAERFKLATHRETKDSPIYALVAPKGAAKLTPTPGDQRLPLVFAPPARLMANDGADGAPSIFTALQDQLGLKLEPQKGQTELLIVDHAERIPTAN